MPASTPTPDAEKRKSYNISLPKDLSDRLDAECEKRTMRPTALAEKAFKTFFAELDVREAALAKLPGDE